MSFANCKTKPTFENEKKNRNFLTHFCLFVHVTNISRIINRCRCIWPTLTGKKLGGKNQEWTLYRERVAILIYYAFTSLVYGNTLLGIPASMMTTTMMIKPNVHSHKHTAQFQSCMHQSMTEKKIFTKHYTIFFYGKQFINSSNIRRFNGFWGPISFDPLSNGWFLYQKHACVHFIF